MPAAALFLAAITACKQEAAEKPGTSAGKDMPASAAGGENPLGRESASTLEVLGDSVQARALRGDTLGLLRLHVDDSAFRSDLYPHSPVYDSAREEVFGFALGMHKANSIKGLRRMLFDIRDPLNGEILSPGFDTVKTQSGTLHQALWPSDRPGIRLFGTALCRKSGCQVASYARGGARSAKPESP